MRAQLNGLAFEVTGILYVTVLNDSEHPLAPEVVALSSGTTSASTDAIAVSGYWLAPASHRRAADVAESDDLQ